MFMAAERRSGMASFLCAALLDFAATERRRGDPPAAPSCGPGACPGLEHLAVLARALPCDAGDAPDALLRRFGTALFPTLLRRYPSFFVGIGSTRELLHAFPSQLAGEIAKLAPHLRLPEVTLQRAGPRALAFSCRFARAGDDLAPLVEGLVVGSIAHFGESLAVLRRGDARGVGPSFAVAARSRAVAANEISSPAGARRAPTGSIPRRA